MAKLHIEIDSGKCQSNINHALWLFKHIALCKISADQVFGSPYSGSKSRK